MRRIEWADAARGLAILAVVWGHTSGGQNDRIVYAWHVPIFFLLSGFLYRPKGSFKAYAAHRARQLLVPFVCWVVLVTGPTAIGEAMKHDGPALLARAHVLALAGPLFGGPTTGYWFLPALYLSLVAYDGLNRLFPRHLALVCVLSYALAVLRSHYLREWRFEGSVDAALIAIPYIHLGRLAREYGWAERRSVLVGGLLVFLAFAAVIYTGHDIPAYDIAQGDNGVPIVDLAFGLSGIATVFLLSQLAGPLTRPLAYVGQATLVILVVHGGLLLSLSRGHFTLPDSIPAPLLHPIGVAIGVGIPLALFPILKAFPITRRLLLGEDPTPRPPKPQPPADEPFAPDPIVEGARP